jgi:hypothetical protein
MADSPNQEAIPERGRSPNPANFAEKGAESETKELPQFLLLLASQGLLPGSLLAP